MSNMRAAHDASLSPVAAGRGAMLSLPVRYGSSKPMLRLPVMDGAHETGVTTAMRAEYDRVETVGLVVTSIVSNLGDHWQLSFRLLFRRLGRGDGDDRVARDVGRRSKRCG